jgi:ATP-dependent protease ClpP protease subunit
LTEHGRKSAKPQFRASLGTDGALELLIYGDIVDSATISMLEGWGYPTDGLISSLNVKKALDVGGDYSKVRLRINSPGGDVFEGMAIHSLLQDCGKPVEARVDGIAASAASVIAMAADTRIMGRTAMMMIHNAWAMCVGNKADMTKMADSLDTIDDSIAAAYVDRTKMSLAAVKSLMDDETWFSAQDCIDNGLATAIIAAPAENEVEVMAQARRFRMLGKLRHVPEQFRASDQCECECEACKDGDCEGCTNEDCDDPNCKDCPMQAGAENNIDRLRNRLTSRSRIAASAAGDHANGGEVTLLESRLRGRVGVADRADEDEIGLLSRRNEGRVKVYIPHESSFG